MSWVHGLINRARVLARKAEDIGGRPSRVQVTENFPPNKWIGIVSDDQVACPDIVRMWPNAGYSGFSDVASAVVLWLAASGVGRVYGDQGCDGQ